MVAFQLTFDCADPEGQAHFWATALRYRVEDAPDGFPTVGAPPGGAGAAGAAPPPVLLCQVQRVEVNRGPRVAATKS
ncbi:MULTISPECIES: VOC family protein [unclassified Streptomyces]|uniref:VOC family protein n=1 Tax=unclassified Streptomyces TaxID=2593676 RepID=UPI00131A24E2|nr:MULTISPECIES: VOC family protein [unclassified Streptomyces]MYX35687.1 hypothetical protein [Streptomyces sp. SID8377]